MSCDWSAMNHGIWAAKKLRPAGSILWLNFVHKADSKSLVRNLVTIILDKSLKFFVFSLWWILVQNSRRPKKPLATSHHAFLGISSQIPREFLNSARENSYRIISDSSRTSFEDFKRFHLEEVQVLENLLLKILWKSNATTSSNFHTDYSAKIVKVPWASG